jgi:hypothetical protein
MNAELDEQIFSAAANLRSILRSHTELLSGTGVGRLEPMQEIDMISQFKRSIPDWLVVAAAAWATLFSLAAIILSIALASSALLAS